MRLVTLYMKNRNIGVDVGVNPKQTILETLEIMNTQGLGIDLNTNYIVLERTNDKVNIHLDYDHANIFDGDKLIV